MNRNAIALAVATAFAAPLAFAQSSVTVGGTINVMWDTVRAGGGTAAAGAGDLKSHDRVRDGAGSNIRFTVIEDLGGGNSAFVQVESAVIANSDTRANAFNQAGAATSGWGNRNSGIGIRSKAAGRFLIGVWDVHYDEMYKVDPGWLIVNSGSSTLGLMNTFGGATTPIAGIGTRYSNVIRWDSPVWSGFSLSVAYARPTDAAPANAPGTVLDNKKNRMWSFAPRYERGGLSVQYSYLQDKDITSNATASLGGVNLNAGATLSAAWKVTSNRLGARYKFGNGLGIGAIWDSSKLDNQVLAANAGSSVGIKRTVWSFPVTYETGNHHMFVTYSRARDWRGQVGGANVGTVAGAGGNLGSDTGAKMWNLGYAYKLSQRTNVHVSYNTIKNDRSAAYDFFAQSSGMTAANAGADPKQFAVGLRHTF